MYPKILTVCLLGSLFNFSWSDLNIFSRLFGEKEAYTFQRGWQIDEKNNLYYFEGIDTHIEYSIIQTPETLDLIHNEDDASKYQKANDPDHTNYDFVLADQALWEIPRRLSEEEINLFNQERVLDMAVFNQAFLRYLNEERTAHGLGELVVNSDLKTLTDYRTDELMAFGSIITFDPDSLEVYPKHSRPDGSSWETIFEDEISYNALGENLLQMPYQGNPYTAISEEYLAEQCFLQWKSSPGHYENMMKPEFSSNYVSIRLTHHSILNSDNNCDFIATQILYD